MPGGDQYPGPRDALDRYLSAVAAWGLTDVKGAKNPYTSRNGHMFSFLAPNGTMALRLPADGVEEFLDRYDSGPVEQYGRTMRGYVSVPNDLVTSPESLTPWLQESWEWVGTLKPK